MKRLLTIFVVVLTFSISAFGECSDADKKALEAFDRAWGKAGETGDKAALMNIYADDYVGLPAMMGKAATIENTMKAYEKDKANPAMADKVAHDLYLITCTPNTATITHRNVITTQIGAGGKPETFWTRSVHFLEKRGGNWQVVSDARHGLDDYAVVGYMELDWANAIKTKDTAWFDKNFASDFSEVSFDQGKTNGRIESIAYTKDDKSVIDDFRLSNMHIKIDGNAAVVTGDAWIRGKDAGGKAMDMQVRFTDTFIRRDGRWQAWSSQQMLMPRQEVAKNP